MVHYPCHHLPQNFYEPYASGFAVTLWYHDSGLPGAFLHEETLAEGGLDQLDKLLSERGVRQFLQLIFL